MQLPGSILVAGGLWLFWDETQLPGWVGVLFFLFWIAKDAALYPLMRRAYQPRTTASAERLVGAQGSAESRLAPDGRIVVRGETWRARAVAGEEPIEIGAAVVVRGVDRFTLLVARVR